MVLAYFLANLKGQQLQQIGVQSYLGPLQEAQHKWPHHSSFGFGLYGYSWSCAMDSWPELTMRLISLKPHKWRYFQLGFDALSQMQKELQSVVIP
jgi:hypothetical protein